MQITLTLTSILKILIAFLGVLATAVLLIWGLVQSDKKKLKQGAMVFLATFAVMIALGAIESFMLLFERSKG